jgi:hypothetical protein
VLHKIELAVFLLGVGLAIFAYWRDSKSGRVVDDWITPALAAVAAAVLICAAVSVFIIQSIINVFTS